MIGWGTLAGTIFVIEWALGKSGRPLLSHDAWELIERDRGWVVYGTVVAVSYHLLAPRRRWRDAVTFGAGAALANRSYRGMFRRVHIP